MSDLFASRNTADSLLAQASANSVDSFDDLAEPGFFTGVAPGTGLGVMRGGAKAATGLGMAAGGAARGLDLAQDVGDILDTLEFDAGGKQIPKSLPVNTGAQDATFATTERLGQSAIDFWTPRANEVGRAGQVLGGLAEVALPLAATAGNPSLLVGSTTATAGKSLIDEGVDAGTAAPVAALEGLATYAGLKAPIVGKSLLTRMASGALGNVAVGSASRAAEKAALDSQEYAEQGKMYAQDGESFSTDFLLGLLFGGVHHVTSPALNPRLTPSQVDAALTARNANHFAQDTAPGVSRETLAVAGHQSALEAAINQLGRGEQVDVGAAVARHDGAEFADDGRIAENARLAEAVEADAPGLRDPLDEFVGPLSEGSRSVFRERYSAASRNKPLFDEQITHLSDDIGASVILADIKSPTRAVGKIVSDYGGDATKIMDLVRGTVSVNDLPHALSAIDQVMSRFDVLPRGQRNLFDTDVEPVDGYRDAKFNVRMPDGTPAEIQIHLPEMLAAKKAVHPLYEKRQALARAIDAEGRDASAAELAQIDALNAQMREVYRPAWEAASGKMAAKRSGDTLAPLRINESSGNLRSEPSSAIARAATPADVDLTTTGTPSTSQKPSMSDTGSPPRESLPRPVTKEFLKKVIDIRPLPDIAKMSKNAGDYVERTADSIDVPIGRLQRTKAERVPDNALKRFEAATKGEIPKREPVSVRVDRNGVMHVVDGNGTVTAMHAIGAKAVPVRIVTDDPSVSKLSLDEALAAKPGDGEQATPEIAALAQLVDENPDAPVLLGFDENGEPRRVTVAQAFEEIRTEYEQAVNDTKAYESAVSCFLGHG